MPLILSRKVGESIIIGDNIRLIILEAGRRGDVRIGIEAPRDIPIERVHGWGQERCDVCGDRITERNEGQSSEGGVVCLCCLGRMRRG